MKKVIKFNTALAADISAALGLISLYLYFSTKDKTAFYIAIGLFLLFVIFLFLFGEYTHTKIENKSNGSVFIKPEDGKDPEEVKSGDIKYGIDGVKINGQVYKLTDGTHAIITENGKVKITSLTAMIFYVAMGGKLNTPPDEDWQTLFDK